MLRNFNKRANTKAGQAQLDSGEASPTIKAMKTRRNSKNSMTYQDSFLDDYFDDDEYTEQKVYRPKTPEIDEEALAGFDMKSQQIIGLIGNKNDKIDLSAESKPVS